MHRVNGKVAIIGAGCRFPGGADDLRKFWALLAQAKNVVSDIPRERWRIERFCSDNDLAAAKSYAHRGHFIDWDYKGFDAGFFHFAPREVESLDPQQRLLLEVAWEALEHAGLDPTRLAGSEVGVYMGGFTLDHMLNQLGSGGRSEIGAHSAAGATLTMLSNRISYAFDFHGPSITIDTACSSSLVAFAYAVRDMLAGTCDMALVGGVNFMLRPEYPIAMSKGQFLARDGRSKSFDARGDGYGRGEGAGVVVLKPLQRALHNNDRILAVVDGAGVNQDGRTKGIKVPNPKAQVSLMRRVVAEAGIDPRSVQYVEAHGTGTPAGDPIEAAAISSVYGNERETACRVGSVKSNIGHLEAAAGVAGIIKACLILTQNQVPALAALEQPNPQIPFGENGLEPADRLSALAPADTTPRVAVNSFGYGGTNAHAVVSLPAELRQAHCAQGAQRHNFCQLMPLSARDDQALAALAGACARHLREKGDSLQDILYSLTRRRAHLSHRLAVWGTDRNELTEALEAFAQQGQAQNAVKAGLPVNADPRPVFVFTGMGPQWWGMGQALYRDHRVFREAVDRADAIFHEIAGFSIRAEMLQDESSSRIQQTRFAQPANFVLQYALTEALRAEGLSPAAVVGHSVGEVTSAWASGTFSKTPQVLIEPAADTAFSLQLDAASGGITLASSRQTPLPADELELRLEALSVEGAAMAQGLRGEADDGQLMGVCGRVTRVGEAVDGMTLGERLCGLMPLALSSHVRVSADRCLLLPVADDPAAEQLAGDSVLQALALRIADSAALTPLDRVLVCASPLGLALASRLRARGIRVEAFPARVEQWTSAQLEELVQAGPIDAIAAPLHHWAERFGFAELSPGGCLIDLGQGLDQLSCDPRVGRLVRIDAALEIGRNRIPMRAALQQVFSGDRATQEAAECLDLAGLSEQKLEAVAGREHLVLRFTSKRSLTALAVDAPDIHTNACYLVTGGFGGLGKEIAKWLATQGAGQLVLCSRSAGMRESDQAFLQQLEQMGCKASAQVCDIAEPEQVQTLVEQISQGEMPLRGVFHTAGMIEDRPIAELTRQDLSKVMRPKALGAWNLHLATRYPPLAHFVCSPRSRCWSATAGRPTIARRTALSMPWHSSGAPTGWPASASTGERRKCRYVESGPDDRSAVAPDRPDPDSHRSRPQRSGAGHLHGTAAGRHRLGRGLGSMGGLRDLWRSLHTFSGPGGTGPGQGRRLGAGAPAR
jgi:3-oxoacyl-(acyl-carrier-protein) synthase